MLNQRRKAAQGIADRLMATEKAMDVAIVQMADLSSFMLTARIEANIATEVGQGALENAAATLVSLVQARGGIIATHKELAVAKDQIGLREVALGGLTPKQASETPGLRVVAQAAA